ncbi:MAG: 16S rRNA (guanine(966)-N(2))-methyltransferase RsmD [Bdellovibrionales bacterium RBG_16_40_8]|nr:MAG: 16S rRNA (guanine(966)-N(2))-methyltransferase RsmD [Bdellovibrionales bacterium RBG_16_40_8]
MRVISGRFKSRRLIGFKAPHIRPTTDRVKETIFNILTHEISDARVLDLFSGTGNLGIEALSRGANYVEFVENNKTSLRIIKDNLQELGVTSNVRVSAQDVFDFLKSYKGEPFSVIFIDPPFTEEIAHKCMLAIAHSQVAAINTRVVIEASRHERIDDKYGPFRLLDRRQFGDKSASFFQRE